MQMGGWFRREITGPDDFRGLKPRSAASARTCTSAWGPSGCVLGVPDIYPALQSGTIDAVEFLGPAKSTGPPASIRSPSSTTGRLSPSRTGRPNACGAGPGRALEPDLRAIVENACGLRTPSPSPRRMPRRRGARGPGRPARVSLRPWPEPSRGRARQAAEEVLAGSHRGCHRQRVHQSYRDTLPRTAAGPGSRPKPISARAPRLT